MYARACTSCFRIDFKPSLSVKTNPTRTIKGLRSIEFDSSCTEQIIRCNWSRTQYFLDLFRILHSCIQIALFLTLKLRDTISNASCSARVILVHDTAVQSSVIPVTQCTTVRNCPATNALPVTPTIIRI